ncbi:MAG: hypothetical protein EP326_07425 [Deltaproteobacteria bacterium]|nr:MAG: hypothetical protein EP326_07425 [Deltaproteobacteria bacterium]TNF27386.1 MAG: hypothetical protein EP319_11715 [Deltaproteobacteria bacterium]
MAYLWNFNLNPGKLHKGGSLLLKFDDDLDAEEILMEIEYEITIKGIVPVPSKFKKGTYKFHVPSLILKAELWEKIKDSKEEVQVEKVVFSYRGEHSGLEIYYLNFQNFITGFIKFERGELTGGPKELEVSVNKIPVAGDYTLSLSRS